MISVPLRAALAIEATSRQWFARVLDSNGNDVGCPIRSIRVTGGSNGNNMFAVGALLAPILEMTVDNTQSVSWQNQEFNVQVGILCPASRDPMSGRPLPSYTEWISLGYFTMIRVERSKYQTTLTGCGRLASKLNATFSGTNLNRIQDKIDRVADQTGVTITVDSDLDTTRVINSGLSMPCRDVLQVLASVLGGFVCERADGTIHIGKYSETPNYTLSDVRMTAPPKLEDVDFSITGVKVIAREAEPSGGGGGGVPSGQPEISYQDGSAPYYTMKNPYMTQLLFDGMASNLIGLEWRPGTVNLALGDPRFEATDVFSVTDIDGVTHVLPCHNYQHTFDGGFMTTVTAYGQSTSLTLAESGVTGGTMTGVQSVIVTPYLNTGTAIGSVAVDGVAQVLYAPSGGSGGSTVSYTPIQTSGTALGTLAIDGSSQNIYAPTPPTAYTSTPAMDGTGSAGSGTTYARGNHVHPRDTSKQDTLVSGTNIKTVNGNSLLGSGDITISGGQNTFSGSCLTTAATATKVVNSSEWVDAHGNIIAVRFTYGNTAQNPYLNINNTGARLIYTSDGVAVDLAWEDGDILTFMRGLYGGGTVCYWLLSKASTLDVADDAYDLADSKSTVSYTPTQTSGTAIGTLTIDNVANTLYAPSSGGSRSDWYATSTSSATNTLTASTTSHDFSLTAGNVVHVHFSNEPNNSTNPFTLNVDGTGAKTIYGSGGQSSTIWKAWAANDVVSFVYSGTNFRIIDAVRATTSNYGETILSSLHNSSAEDVAATSKAVKDAYDLANGKSTVSWSQSQSSGTKIATVTIDGTPTDVYAPTGGGGGGGDTVSWTQLQSTGDQIATVTINGTPTNVYSKNYETEIEELYDAIPSVRLNGNATTSASFYAPTTAGTSGQILKSNGSGAPTWASGGGDTVTWTQTQTTGTKIAAISINGASTDVYAPSGGVSGVKGNSESTYRTGNVNLTSANIGAVDLGDKYTRSSAGDLGWTSTTDGDAKVIAKSALAFWNGAYSGNSSNLSKCSTGNIIGSNGGTMTGQLLTSFKSSVAMGSYQAAATTVPNLANEIRFSSGCTGSVNIGTAYTKGSVTVPTGWYNFFYSPHRSGGVNGAASGDNCNYGTILLSGMTVSGLYRIRVQGSSDYVAELEKVYTSTTPYITAQGTTGSTWTYRKWSNGYQECWYHGSITFTTAGASYQGWYRSTQTISLPTATGFTAFADTACVQASGSYNAHVLTSAGLVKTNGTQLEVQILGMNAIAANTAVPAFNIYVAGYAR